MEDRDKRFMLPYHVIASASKGDTEAMSVILKHYDGYIAKLCTKTMLDQYGNKSTYIDEEMRNRLKIRLITRTLSFRVS